jgi:hypothetical protein
MVGGGGVDPRVDLLELLAAKHSPTAGPARNRHLPLDWDGLYQFTVLKSTEIHGKMHKFTAL